MFFLNPNFYYISVILQAICVFHCIRKGNQNKWIWIIVFLPFIGCLIYFFTEIVNSRDIQKVQSGLGEVFNPSGSIRKLEDVVCITPNLINDMHDGTIKDGDEWLRNHIDPLIKWFILDSCRKNRRSIQLI